MAEPRTAYLTAAALAAAFAAGAGADRIAVDVYEPTARISTLRRLPDGAVAVGINYRIGRCADEREVVFRDGVATLDGRPTNAPAIAQLGALVSSFVADPAIVAADVRKVRIASGTIVELADGREVVAEGGPATATVDGVSTPGARAVVKAVADMRTGAVQALSDLSSRVAKEQEP
jgi:hypothetical protein